jgi:hypothetical protein
VEFGSASHHFRLSPYIKQSLCQSLAQNNFLKSLIFDEGAERFGFAHFHDCSAGI